MAKNLHQIQRRSPEALLAPLLSDSPGTSREFGEKLVSMAKGYDLGLRDFLTLAVDAKLSEKPDLYAAEKNRVLPGYQASLAYLKLPVKDDMENGIVLDLASDTFQTFPGTRALFPEVVDDIVKWKYRQDNLEVVAPLVSNSRTISGVEMISTVINDTQADYQYGQPIAETARIPVKTIRSTQNSVGIFKHGMGYRTSYEFERRVRLDLLTPYAARAQREMDISKVKCATLILLNGDGVQGAAPEVDQTTFVSGATAGTINRTALLMWLVSRAKAGTPVDTVVGNWDAYIQWLLLFTMPTADQGRTQAEILASQGFKMGGVPILNGVVNFALSSTAPANKLIGLSAADTLEELVEAGSLINESERSVINQTITYYKTENTGYRLVFGDTRSVFDFGN